jgi:hypothetical protein
MLRSLAPQAVCFQAVCFDASIDGVEQRLLAMRLRKELDRSRLHRHDRHGNVAVAGDEDYGQKIAGFDQDFLKLESAGTRQSDVEHDASWRIGTRAVKKLLRGSEGHHRQAHRLKKILDAVTRGRVIIDDKHQRLLVLMSCCISATMWQSKLKLCSSGDIARCPQPSAMGFDD